MTPLKNRVLVIEDDRDYTQLVRIALGEPANAFELLAVSELASGLAAIDRHRPEVILLDLSLPDSSGYETFLRVREHAQGIPIIVLTGLDDDQTAVQAIADGAQDFLVKSLVQPKLLVRSIKMAMRRQDQQPSEPGKGASPRGLVTSFIGSKGGVGTSTTAVNVAAVLSQNQMDTVAVEVKSGGAGGLSVYVENQPGDGLGSLFRKPADTITPVDVQKRLVQTACGLQLLCPTSVGGTVLAWDASHLQALVSALRRLFRNVLLDLPPQLDEAVTDALKLSTSVTLVVDRERTSIRCAEDLLPQIKALKASQEIQVAVVDRTGLSQPPSLLEIEKELTVRPLVVIPHVADKIALSHSARTPLVLLYPDDPFSVMHIEMAERLLAIAGRGIRLRRTPAWHTRPEMMYG